MAGGGGESSEYEVNINLTALLDVLTNLLFFLMLGMAAQEVNMELEGGLQLPNSTAEGQPPKTVSVTVAKNELRVEKEPIAALANEAVVGFASGRIEPLYKRLVALKDKSNKTTEGSNQDVVLVFADEETPYPLLHQVLNTAAEAGFPNARMAVLME